MSYFLIISFLFSLLTFAAPQDDTQLITRIITNEQTGAAIIQSKPIPMSGPKDRYHSLSLSISYPFHPDWSWPKKMKFELVSVVKARRLNSDLYVVFVVDGKEIHFSSNRSAIRNPVPEKPWIGERMVFQIPYEEFHKMVKAKTLSVKLGGVTFDFPDTVRRVMSGMDFSIRQPTA